MEMFDSELKKAREFTINLPVSVNGQMRNCIFNKIEINVKKLNNPIEKRGKGVNNIICKRDKKENKLFITTNSVKQYYKVLSALQLISTIYINYGINYRANEPPNNRGDRRGGGENYDDLELISLDDVLY